MMKLKPEQELLKALEKARTISKIIVEGKKDKIALEKLGFINKNIIVLHKNCISLYSVLDKINRKECVTVLTDFDKKGRQYYWMLKQELIKKGIRVNDELRRAILKNRISHIEGLATYVKNHL